MLQARKLVGEKKRGKGKRLINSNWKVKLKEKRHRDVTGFRLVSKGLIFILSRPSPCFRADEKAEKIGRNSKVETKKENGRKAIKDKKNFYSSLSSWSRWGLNPGSPRCMCQCSISAALSPTKPQDRDRHGQ